MEVYLPIAEMAINPYLMIGIGMLIGCISGLFGIGGGFLLTPLLLLCGIPANIAIVSGANVSVAASMSGFIPQLERKAFDLRMALLVSIAGVIGVGFGTGAFKILQTLGAAESVIHIAYVILLSYVGYSLLRESLASIFRKNKPLAAKHSRHSTWSYKLPWKIKFPRSKLYISVIPPILIGLIIGFLSAIMGVGGGFLLIPALIYIVNMPPSLVVGTSIFQVLVMSSMTTFLQASTNGGLDLVLSGILIFGAVIGAQFGSLFGKRIKGEQLRVLLGAIIIILALVLMGQMFFKPQDLFGASSAGGGL